MRAGRGRGGGWGRGWGRGRAAVLVGAAAFAVYLATAAYAGPLSPDPLAAAMPAWHLATTGSPYLEGSGLTSQWFGESNGHLVSNRFMGVVLFGVPFYAVLSPLLELLGLTGAGFTLVPAAVASATAAAITVALLYLLLRRLADARPAVGRLANARPGLTAAGALAVTVVFALGTPTWSVSADALWPHGPIQLWLLLALVALTGSKPRYALAGLVAGLAVITRLHCAVIPLVLGVWLAVSRRSWRPLVGLGASAWALPALAVWNHWVYGTWTLGGGYQSHFAAFDPAVASGDTVVRYLVNVAGTLVAPDRGLLMWTPVLIFLAAGLPWAWRAAPDWVRAVAVAGLAYLAVQLQVNGFSGGMNFYGYRLALEALTLATPLLALAAASPAVWGTSRRTAVVITAGVQATIIALGAILPLPYLWVTDLTWQFWKPALLARDHPVAGTLIVVAGVAATVATTWMARRRDRLGPSRQLPVQT